MNKTPSNKKVVLSPAGNRMAAIFIDSLILLIPAYLVTALLPETWGDILGFKNSVVMALFLIYNPIMECLGGTFGKKFVKSYAIDLKTQSPPTYLVALGRFTLSILPILVVGYGSAVKSPTTTLTGIALLAIVIVPVFFSKRKQTLYDHLTNVIIIEFEPTNNKNVTTPDN